MRKRVKIALLVAFSAIVIVIVILLLNYKIFADQALALATPSDLTVTEPTTQSSADLKWTDNYDNETGYIIERTDDMVHDFQKIATLGRNATSYSDSWPNFIKNTRYYYRTKAFNSFGSSEYSPIATPQRDETYNLIQGTGSFEQESIDNSTGIGWYKSYVLPESNVNFYLDDKGLNNSKSQYIGLKGSLANGYNGLYADVGTVDENSEYTIKPGDSLSINIKKYFLSGSYEKSYVRIGFDFRDKNGKALATPRSSPDRFTENNPGVFSSPEYELPANTYNVKIVITLYAFNLIGPETVGINLDEIAVNVKKAGQAGLATFPVPARKQTAMLTQGLQFWDFKYPYEVAKTYDIYRLEKPEYVPMIKYYNPNIQLLYSDKLGFDDARTASNTDLANAIKLHLKMAYVLNNHPEWLIPYNNQKLERPSGDRIQYLYLDPNRDPDPEGSKQYLTKRTDGTTPMNFVSDDFYQLLYWPDPTNQSYQQELRKTMVQNVKKLHFDGLWFDNTNPINYAIYNYKDGAEFDLNNLGPDDPSPKNLDDTNRQALVYNAAPNKMQDFTHGILPYIHQENVKIALNNAMSHYDDWPAKVLLDPFWDPADPGNVTNSLWQPSFKNKILTNNFDEVKNDPTAVQYKKNSLDTTPDTFFQEWAFFPHNTYNGIYRNRYTVLNHWLKTIQDMDIVEEWNKNIPETKKKTISQLVVSVDRPDLGDPFLNPVPQNEKSNLNRYDNGSAYFGLTSFLLGSNQYSYFGMQKNTINNANNNVTTYSDLKTEMYDDINFLGEKLGEPTETRKIILDGTVYDKDDAALSSDDKKILQIRKFTHGLVVVNGSPDQNKTYTLEAQMKDELERVYPAGTQLTLQPHSGRVFFNFAATTTPTTTTTTTTKTTKPPTSKLPILTPAPTSALTPDPTPTPETPDQPISEETNDQAPSSGTSTTPNTDEVKTPTPSPETTAPSDPETENLTPSPKESKSPSKTMTMGYRAIYYFFIPLFGIIILIVAFVLIKRKFDSRR